MSSSSWPYGLQPTRLFYPWDFAMELLEEVPISFSRGSSRPRNWTCVSYISYIGRCILYHWANWEVLLTPSRCLVAQSHPTPCSPMDCGKTGFPAFHPLPECAQIHVHWVGDAIQPSHPLLSSSPALNRSQYQDLSQWVGSWHQVAKVLHLQLQHQSFQWIFRTDFL